MFLNADSLEEDQTTGQIPQSKTQQKPQRFAQNRFQAKPAASTQPPISRIQQKQQEQQVQKQVEVKQEIDVAQESIMQFDSGSEEGDKPLINSSIPNDSQANQLKQERLNPFGILENNNHKSGYGEEEIDFKKLSYIGNNHNPYFEPAVKFDEEEALPQLKKPIQLEQKQQQAITKMYQDQQIDSEEDDNHHYEEQDHQVLEQQEELRKELKQTNEKVMMQDEDEEQEQQYMQQDEPKNQSEQAVEPPQQQFTEQDQVQYRPLCPYPRPMIEIPMPNGKKAFLLSPSPKGGMIQCTIKRDKSGMSRFYPKYHMHISNGFLYLMSAKKRSLNNTSNYLLSLAREDMQNEQNYIGKVRSNFIGTEFILYDSGKNPKKCKDSNQFRQELGVVFYDSNILGTKGPRKMRVFNYSQKVLLPKVNEQSNQAYQSRPFSNKEGLLQDYRNGKTDNILACVNRPPQWNSKHKAFVLNFYQRVDKPSVKNFQLIKEGEEDNILLQFGRVGSDLFNLDFQWPITPLQAFQIVLSSFDYKIACE